MKCLILAAGYATRLYPLTENFPKPLLEVQGRSILDRLIDDVDRSGEIDEYIVISNAKFAPHFRAWAEGRDRVTVLDDGTTSNETRLGAVRDVQFAVETLGITGDALILAGDNLLDFSLTRFVDYAKAKRASAVMRYYEPSLERLRKCGVMTVDEEGRILEMAEKPAEPKSHWCCPPFYYYTAKDLARIGEGIRAGCGVDAPGSYVAWLSSVSPVYAMEMPGSRYDIGNLESYERVQKEYKGIC